MNSGTDLVLEVVVVVVDSYHTHPAVLVGERTIERVVVEDNYSVFAEEDSRPEEDSHLEGGSRPAGVGMPLAVVDTAPHLDWTQNRFPPHSRPFEGEHLSHEHEALLLDLQHQYGASVYRQEAIDRP